MWADETLNTTSAETLALSFATHVAMVELYRLEARLKEEQEEKKTGEREARQARKQRRLEKKERRKERDAKRTKQLLQQKKAERKKKKMDRREKKKLKRAEQPQRTKVTVKIFSDSAGALLMLDGQLPITTPGLRMSAMAAIEQSMELERRFINREAASALMDVSLELHWVPGHPKRREGDEARRRLHKRADKVARLVRDWASNGLNDWHRGCGYPIASQQAAAYLAGLNDELPECDEPVVSRDLLLEQIGELPQQPLSQ